MLQLVNQKPPVPPSINRTEALCCTQAASVPMTRMGQVPLERLPPLNWRCLKELLFIPYSRNLSTCLPSALFNSLAVVEITSKLKQQSIQSVKDIDIELSLGF